MARFYRIKKASGNILTLKSEEKDGMANEPETKNGTDDDGMCNGCGSSNPLVCASDSWKKQHTTRRNICSVSGCRACAGDSCMTQTVYLKLKQITQMQKKEVCLSDIAEVFCQDKATASRCRAVRVKTFHSAKKENYTGSITQLISLITQAVPGVEINSVGETDFVISYDPAPHSHRLWQWCKTLFGCVITFCGAAFAIMTFNNDASVLDVFSELYRLVMGKESDGLTILEFSYSIGLAGGILLFFNHFAGWKLNTDPTPLEVEMRLYEENVNKTVIQNEARKETDIDVS